MQTINVANNCKLNTRTHAFANLQPYRPPEKKSKRQLRMAPIKKFVQECRTNIEQETIYKQLDRKMNKRQHGMKTLFQFMGRGMVTLTHYIEK